MRERNVEGVAVVGMSVKEDGGLMVRQAGKRMLVRGEDLGDV